MLLLGPEGFMAVNTVISRSSRSTILAHLRTLRGSLGKARDALMHYKDDRLDRDKLEPASRRVDDLMNMFASDRSDPRQSSAWVTEILDGVELVTNPKANAALRDARAEITLLLDVMGADAERPPSGPN